MKKGKKLLSVLMAVLISLVVLPAAAFAAEDAVIATGNGGEGITWTLTEGGLLRVSGNGPIVDKEEIEDYGDGTFCTTKLDCIGWQLFSVFEKRTEGFGAEQRAYALYDFVKEIVIEEGITAIPDGEFSDFYPRSITLPSTLTSIGSGCVNARFAETLTIKNKDLLINGNITVSGYNKDAEPYATLQDAIKAKVEFETAISAVDEMQAPVYELGYAYEVKLGLSEDVSQDDYVANFNEFYGTEFQDIDACIACCIERVNANFGTNYESADQAFTVVTDDDGTHLERNASLEEQISGMYGAIVFDENKLVDMNLGATEYEENVAYSWLTVYGPSGGEVEKAAGVSGVKFVSTDEPVAPDNSFFGRVKRFFASVKAFFVRIINRIKLHFSILK